MSNDGPLAALRRPDAVELTPHQRGQFEDLLRILERDEHAPTTVRARAEAAEVHLADSLAALALPGVADARTIADLGAGAGFPGLALAIALPHAHVSLVESQRRKCRFIERARDEAEVANARVICARAEEWREGLGAHDLVLARAVAEQPVVLEYAAPLLCLGGALVDWRGARVGSEEEAAERAGAELGLRRVEVRRVTPFPGARDHHLHLYLKVSVTPECFPRRAGVARKRPLGHTTSMQGRG
jgi:16S rRNA (guanine527-N7)-methyltransferase